jgi:hypothetical protein
MNKELKQIDYEDLKIVNKLFLRVLQLVNFSNKNISFYLSNLLPIVLATLCIGLFVGYQMGTIWLLGISFFQLILMYSCNHYRNTDVDHLRAQIETEKEENTTTNGWSKVAFKKRLKVYGKVWIAFTVIFSTVGFPLEQTLSIQFLYLLTNLLLSLIPTTVVAVIVEYTLGGLHRSKKLHIILFILIIIYSGLKWAGVII